MIEKELDITTAEGKMKTFIYHPESNGPHPVVLYLMDGLSIRPALQDMAMRLASAGYYVMLPFLFYRASPFRQFGRSDEDMHARQELMGTITPTNVLGDTTALLAHASGDSAASDGPVGAVGFCMSGGLVMALAKAEPERVKAIASIHGAWLVRDSADSPHLGLDAATAEMYFGWSDNDPTAPPEHVPIVRDSLDKAGVVYDLDWFTDAEHGYALAGPRYNRYASELHWERVHSLFRRHL